MEKKMSYGKGSSAIPKFSVKKGMSSPPKFPRPLPAGPKKGKAAKGAASKMKVII